MSFVLSGLGFSATGLTSGSIAATLQGAAMAPASYPLTTAAVTTVGVGGVVVVGAVATYGIIKIVNKYKNDENVKEEDEENKETNNNKKTK